MFHTNCQGWLRHGPVFCRRCSSNKLLLFLRIEWNRSGMEATWMQFWCDLYKLRWRWSGNGEVCWERVLCIFHHDLELLRWCIMHIRRISRRWLFQWLGDQVSEIEMICIRWLCVWCVSSFFKKYVLMSTGFTKPTWNAPRKMAPQIGITCQRMCVFPSWKMQQPRLARVCLITLIINCRVCVFLICTSSWQLSQAEK